MDSKKRTVFFVGGGILWGKWRVDEELAKIFFISLIFLNRMKTQSPS